MECLVALSWIYSGKVWFVWYNCIILLVYAKWCWIWSWNVLPKAEQYWFFTKDKCDGDREEKIEAFCVFGVLHVCFLLFSFVIPLHKLLAFVNSSYVIRLLNIFLAAISIFLRYHTWIFRECFNQGVIWNLCCTPFIVEILL